MNELKEQVAKAVAEAEGRDYYEARMSGSLKVARAAIAAIHKFLGDYFVEDWPAVFDAAMKETKDETS